MKSFLLTLFTLFFVLFLGCKKEEPKTEIPKPVTQTELKTSLPDSTILRSDTVDVASLDMNRDGKVFQCPMHFEVISDNPGTCPLCKMELEDVTVKQAAKNLK